MMAKEPVTHFLKPGEGRAVLRPDDATEWSAEGEEVEETRFVRRRMACGDLVEAERPEDPDPEDAEPEGEAEPAGDEKPEPEAKPAKRPRRKSKEG